MSLKLSKKAVAEYDRGEVADAVTERGPNKEKRMQRYQKVSGHWNDILSVERLMINPVIDKSLKSLWGNFRNFWVTQFRKIEDSGKSLAVTLLMDKITVVNG